MSDDLKTALEVSTDERWNLNFWTSLLTISLLMGACASIMSHDMRSFRGFLRCTVLGLGASYLVGSALENSTLSLGYIHCIVGLSALYANYGFIFLKKVIELVVDDPRGFIDNILDRILGHEKPTKKE